MDQVFGFVGDGYVLLAADATNGRSFIAYKHDEDKLHALDSHKLMGTIGPQADTAAFAEYIAKNISLNNFRTDLTMSTSATASYVRNELATALRKGPYQVDMLIGGVEKETGSPSLYFIDYLAACAQLNYGAQGVGGRFVAATLDCHWKAGLSLEEGIKLARACMKEMRMRMTISPARFYVKVITKDGIKSMPEVDDAARA